MNRAVMLRIAACGTIGLGAALLIAALLLSTYTSSKITRIPLDIDATLISDGTGTAIDSASLSAQRMVVNKDIPVVSQQQVSVESPANAYVVTLQVGNSLRRTDKQKDHGLLLAIVDTVTLNRKTTTRRPRSRCDTTGYRTASRSTPRRRLIPTLTRSRRRRLTSTTRAKTTSTA